VSGNEATSAPQLAALAWAAHRRGQTAEAACLASRASSAAAGLSRERRQQVEVVCLAVAGDSQRACDLAAEHLAEFPDDELVRAVHERCGR
jgi:hypothetical protein